jgi:hypothetical protein
MELVMARVLAAVQEQVLVIREAEENNQIKLISKDDW